MDSPFIYDRYVTGKNFIGRRGDCTVLGNLIMQGEHVVFMEPPKTGVMSLIQQTLFNLRMAANAFVVGQFSLLNVRDLAGFLTRMGGTVLRTVASTPGEYADLIATHLGGTHFVFDQKNYSDNDQIVSLNWDPDDEDIMAMLRLPYRIARESGQQIFLIIDEFQNLEFTGEGDRVYKALEKVMGEIRGDNRPGCSFILCGSRVNAMKDIFQHRRFFYRMVEHLPLSTVDEKEIIEYVVRGFLSSGKVVERELLLGMCRLFRNNLWYIAHFTAICDSLSKGYIIEATLMEALGNLISIHEPRFASTMNSLTTFQVGLLRAILDGHKRFSASEIIQRYGLNSSANVKRLKDALMKKEIVTFDEKDEPTLLDPLFEYWVRKYFFEMQ